MKLEQIEHVVEIAKCKSISQAAYRLFLSQPTLSLSIKCLEDEIGNTIFVRNSKGVSLTAFGKEFVSYAEAIQLQVNQLNGLSRQKRPVLDLRISIANIGFRFVADACAQLYRLHENSGIEINLYDTIGYDTIDNISANLYEIGLMRIWSCYKKVVCKQMQMKSVQFFPLTQVPVSIVIGRGNPLYSSDIQVVSTKQLQKFPLMMYSHMDAGPYSSVIKELHLPSAHNRILVSSRASNYEMLDKTPAFYVTATPRAAYQHTDYYPFARSLLLENCNLNAEIGWIKNESYNPTPLANEFIRILNSYFY